MASNKKTFVFRFSRGTPSRRECGKEEPGTGRDLKTFGLYNFKKAKQRMEESKKIRICIYVEKELKRFKRDEMGKIEGREEKSQEHLGKEGRNKFKDRKKSRAQERKDGKQINMK